MTALRATALATALCLAGCSVLTFERVDGPAAARPEVMPVCSGSQWATALDVAGTVITSVYVAVGLAIKEHDEDGDRQASTNLLLSSTPLALAYWLSTGYGLRERKRCQSARSAHDAWLRNPRPESSFVRNR